MSIDFAAMFAAGAEKAGRNMHNATGAALPEVGTAYGRLVGVVEIGEQQTTYKGKPTKKNQIALVFELSGPKWPASDEGRLQLRMTKFTNSDSSNSRLFKLMKRLDPQSKYRHIGQLIGQVFFVEIQHNTRGDKTFADIGEIQLPHQQNMVTGKVEDYSGFAADQVATSMGFMWDYPSLAQWDNMFIEGTYDDGGSKNRYQKLVRQALNFENSPVFNLLSEDNRDPWADYEGGKEVAGSATRNRKEARDRNARIVSGASAGEEGDDANSSDEESANRAPRAPRAPRTPAG